MITTKYLLNKYPDPFKKLGGIFNNLNLIEVAIIHTITTFFLDNQNIKSGKNFIINDALSDKDIFPNMENKRLLLKTIIKVVGKIAKEKNKKFNETKWLDICKSIKKLQELRNNLAHHVLIFSKDGEAEYLKKRTNEELIQYRRTEDNEKTIKLNLNKEFEKSEKIYQEATQLTGNFITEALNILN